eukprot:m.165842 g.165842  ORF g.165842 m.165842 type:complete len:121 (-) comp24989_c1_seq4:1520-1882(-)
MKRNQTNSQSGNKKYNETTNPGRTFRSLPIVMVFVYFKRHIREETFQEKHSEEEVASANLLTTTAFSLFYLFILFIYFLLFFVSASTGRVESKENCLGISCCVADLCCAVVKFISHQTQA